MSAHLLDCIEDAWEAQVNLKHACRSCGSLSRTLEDGACPKCCGFEPDSAARDIRPSISKGHANAARLLRSMGFADEALWHEERARR